MKDGRSFSVEGFNKVLAILDKHKLVPTETFQTFKAFAKRVEDASKKITADEEDLGEIPDEFLGWF